MDEMSQTVDEAKLSKVVDEMLRQRCTSRDEHQYHIDQMKNFLKNDIVWESRKEIIVAPHPQRPNLVVQSCQRDPKAPALSLVNQDLLTSRWVDKYVKKFNLYARYNVKHWKNPHAKIFYIKKQKELGKPKEVVYSNLKIVQIIKTYWELGHEHKFITEIVARRANGSIVSITESDYKNLKKNVIEDMYLLIVNHKVDDYAKTGVESYQQKVNLTTPTITFPDIEKFKVFFIVSESMYGITYKNIKKEKRVMRHQEVHKFCDATLKRVLEGLKSYNNDVKHGYVTPSLSNEDVEYLQLFEEEIEERLKHRDQMRRCWLLKERKFSSKSSKTDKFVHAEETIHDVEMKAKESIEEDMVDAEDTSQADASDPKLNDEKDTLTFNDVMGSVVDFTKFTRNCLKKDKITKADLEGPAFKLLKGKYKKYIKIEYNFEQCYLALTDQIDRLNPKGDRIPHELGKPIPLHDAPCRLTILVDLFFNKDLEYLTTGNVENHKVYPQIKILSIIRMSVDKQFVYGYLKEIVVRRADQKEYTFTEVDFPRLYLDDIKDKYLLCVGLDEKEPYIVFYEPKGVVYLNKDNNKFMMRADEVYKFGDGTLKKGHDKLYYMLHNFELGYNDGMPKRA
ncbi:hypothetical protein Tco_1440381 [Tanacetum coccineum]